MPDQMALPLEALQVRSSPRARRLALRVHLDGRVEVVVPRGVPSRQVEAFVVRHREWIAEKLAARKVLPPEPFPPSHLELHALGERFAVHCAGGRGPLRVIRQGEVLTLRGAWDSSGLPAARAALLRFVMTHVRDRLEARLRALAAEGEFPFRSLQLRRQRTRWGSCSSRGVISLNVCAVFQTPEVLEYLLIHELVHTRHMNHSASYWKTVGQWCPDWQRLDRELTRGWSRVPSWVFAQR